MTPQADTASTYAGLIFWAALYITRLLVELTPKGVIFPVLCLSAGLVVQDLETLRKLLPLINKPHSSAGSNGNGNGSRNGQTNGHAQPSNGSAHQVRQCE